MNKLLTLFVLMLFSSATLVAQQAETNSNDKEETEKAVDGPKLTLEKATVDYGEIENGSDPLRVVSFTNTGNAPLIISNAKGSCGCTVPTWPREPIAPGESAEIEIRYDTKRTGPINKTVRLTTNDATGQYTIRVTGKVKAKVEQEGLPKKKDVLKPGGNR